MSVYNRNFVNLDKIKAGKHYNRQNINSACLSVHKTVVASLFVLTLPCQQANHGSHSTMWANN